MDGPRPDQRPRDLYDLLAPAYDDVLGSPMFFGAQRAFETLVRRYRIRFSSAADIGCGTGLFARYLSRCWGVPVFGVDLSRGMLRVAAANCAGTGVRLLHQDLRCLRLPEPVDLIVSTFDTLNHLTLPGDLARAFRRIRLNLRPGGHLLFDLITPCQGNRRRMARSWRDPVTGRRIVQGISWHPDRRLFRVTVAIRIPEPPYLLCGSRKERAFSPAEAVKALLDSGFTIRGVHDGVTLESASECIPRIIVIAHKPSTPSREFHQSR